MTLLWTVFRKAGFFFIIIMVVVFFVATHSRQNEMVYVALVFAFIAIALFSFGFWRAVNRGDGVWQYIGKHNLQHQQVSNPNYHFRSVPNYKGHPKSRVHVVQPPKMGGVRLEIYTLSDDDQLRKASPGQESLHQSRHSSSGSRHHHRHEGTRSHHHHRHHRHHQEKVITTAEITHSKAPSPSTVNRASDEGGVTTGTTATQGQHISSITPQKTVSPLLTTDQNNCANLCEMAENGDDSEPIKIEVNFARRHNEDFELVELPPLNR